jgi:hypothetical protein
MADPFTPDEETSVTLTLKADKGYDAPWLVFKAPSVQDLNKLLTDGGEDVSRLLALATGVSVAFMNQYDKRMNPPKSGEQGKSEEAKLPSQEVGQDPFVKSGGYSEPYGIGAKGSPEPMRACQHGKMELVTHKGKTGHVCPLPKGAEGRCETIFV